MSEIAQIIAASGFAIFCVLAGMAALIWARYESGGSDG